MLLIPLATTPNQVFNVILNGQSCTLNIYQKFWGVFMDVFVSGNVIIQGVFCLNQNFIVQSPYLGFIGDLQFNDTKGSSDPEYQGFGPIPSSRYQLQYLFPDELPSTYGENPFSSVDASLAWVSAFPTATIPYQQSNPQIPIPG